MSYRIEITAASLAELAGKVASLAVKLNAGAATEAPSNPIMPELREATITVTAVDPKPEPAPEPEPEAAPAPKTDVPDFDSVVTPLVLKLVEVRGKPVAQEVLGRFGVVKASQLGSDQWQELVDAINAELGQ